MVKSRSLLRRFALALLLSTVTAVGAPLAVGTLFPSLATAALAGTPPAMAGQVVIVDFWVSWCAPCRASFPAYSRLQKDYAARGVVILGISVDESPAAYAGFVAKLQPAFATLHDGGHQLVAAVAVPTMPTCYVLDRAGRVRFIHAGFHGSASESELRRELEQLLAERDSRS